VVSFPANSGTLSFNESKRYDWLKHHGYAITVGGAITPGSAMPGYPAVSPISTLVTGRKRMRMPASWVMLAPVGVDLLSSRSLPAGALLACPS